MVKFDLFSIISTLRSILIQALFNNWHTLESEIIEPYKLVILSRMDLKMKIG